jgi:23S rRNA (pseudouridine1915-N3)-methyltransferase
MIILLCFGLIKDKDIFSLISTYAKRLRIFPAYDISRVSFSPSNGFDNEKKILDYMNKHPQNTYVLFDERGKDFTSIDLSSFLKNRLVESKVVFIIGDAQGFSKDFKNNFSTIIKLSSFTLTHEFAELLFYEQIYRCAMISSNRAYHK